MPARYAMTWEAGPRRWKKVYRGRAYTVSCRQLGTRDTKEASYQAANAWWAAKKLEIDVQSPPHPHAEYLAVLAARLAYARRHGDADDAAMIARETERVAAGGEPAYYEAFRGIARFVLGDRPNHPSPSDPGALSLFSPKPFFAEDHPLEPKSALWDDRVARDNADPVPEDQTVGGLINAYIALRETRVQAGDIGPRGHANMADCLHHFRDWIGAGVAIAVIDARRWESYWKHLHGKPWSRDYKSKMFRTARQFIEWVGQRDPVATPKNLRNRELHFGRGARAIETMSIDEVRMLVEKATGQLPLHLLLMANTGMTQQDISDLQQDEVDWERGRITRRRSKTGGHDNVPTVSYPLWPPTFTLLQQHRAKSGDRALLTSRGGPWVFAEMADGKLRRSDNIAANYHNLKKRLGFSKRLKLLRKTSASLLDNHPEFGRYAGHFLGHAPQTIRDRHYVQPSRERFDEAVVWLGRQYGFVDAG